MKNNTKNIIKIILFVIIPLFLLNSKFILAQLEDTYRFYSGIEIKKNGPYPKDQILTYYNDVIYFNHCKNSPNFLKSFSKVNESILNNFLLKIAISDKKTGNILFYIFSDRLYDSKFNIIENSDSVFYNSFNNPEEESIYVVPFPNSISKYYIFQNFCDHEITIKFNTRIYRTRYSILDISANKGNGKIIKKGLSIDSNFYKYYSFVPISHRNGKDFWLMANDTIGNFSTFLVNENGITLKNNIDKKDLTKMYYIKRTDKQSFIKNIFSLNYNWLFSKAKSLSPDGKKMIIYDLWNLYKDSTSYYKDSSYPFFNFTIAKFENEIGKVRNPVTISIPIDFIGDISNYSNFFFSPNSEKLFLEYPNGFYEWDLTNWDSLNITNSIKKVNIFKDKIYYSFPYFLRDGNLYVSNFKINKSLNNKFIKISNLNNGINESDINRNFFEFKFNEIEEDAFNNLNPYIPYHAFLYHFIDYKKPVCETQKLEFDLLPFVPKGAEEDPKVIFEWKGPENFFSLLRRPSIDSVTQKNSGWYYLTLFTPEDTLRDSLYIDIPLKNYIKISSNKKLPCHGDTVTLAIDSTYKSIYWNTGDSTKSIKVTKPGKYSVMIEDENCCNSYDEIEVVYATPPNPEIEIIGNNPSCYGDTVIIKPKYNYSIISWDDGDTNRIRKITKTSSFELTVIDSNGCSAKSNIEIKFANKPKPTIAGDTKICLGTISTYTIATNKTTKKDITISGGSIQSQTESEIKILWDKVGEYLVEIIETDTINGCIGKTSLNITVDSLKKPTIRQDIPLCYGSFGKLSVLETYDTYLWSTGEKTQSIFVTKSGNYKVICTLSGGCSDSSEITLNEVPKPKIEIISDKGNTICQKGEKITLSVNPNDPEYSYFWSTGLITPSITVSDSGTYYLFAVNKYGCADTAIYRINIAPEFTPEITANKFKICKGEELELSANPNQTDYKYLWSNGLTSSKITIKDPGTYKVKVSNQFGCTKEIEQKIGQNPSISIQLDTSRAQIGNSTEITMTIFCESKIQLNNIEIKLIIDGSSLIITEEQKYLTYNYLPNQNLELILKIDSIDFNKSSKMQYKVRGNTLLANNLNNPIIIDNVSLKADEFCIEKIPGALILEKICTFDLRKVKLIEEFNFEILPNPASDYIEISLSPVGRGRGWTPEIFNVFGENTTPSNLSGLPPLLAKEGIIKIDISNLPAGVYFIKIGDKFEKFVKL